MAYKMMVTQDLPEDCVLWNTKRELERLFDQISLSIQMKRAVLIGQWREKAKLYNTLVNAERDNQRWEDMFDTNFNFNQ